MLQTKSKKVFYPFCTFFASFLSNERKSGEKCQKGHKSFVNLLMSPNTFYRVSHNCLEFAIFVLFVWYLLY